MSQLALDRGLWSLVYIVDHSMPMGCDVAGAVWIVKECRDIKDRTADDSQH